MFSQTAEYAMRAMMHLAYHPQEPQTALQISEGTHVPLPYLSKVLQSLGRAGLIHAQRGLHGGFTLMMQPEDLNLLTVLNAVDPIRRFTACPLGFEAHGSSLCPLHRRLDEALAIVERSLRETNLAELLAESTASKPLCPFPIEFPTAEKL